MRLKDKVAIVTVGLEVLAPPIAVVDVIIQSR